MGRFVSLFQSSSAKFLPHATFKVKNEVISKRNCCTLSKKKKLRFTFQLNFCTLKFASTDFVSFLVNFLLMSMQTKLKKERETKLLLKNS